MSLAAILGAYRCPPISSRTRNVAPFQLYLAPALTLHTAHPNLALTHRCSSGCLGMALLCTAPDPDSPPTASSDETARDWKEIEDEDDNMLVKLQQEPWRQAFFDDLQSQIPNICGIVSHHLSLSLFQQCEVSDRSEWLYGSFNVCIPINVTNWRKQRLLLRCPLPYMLGGPDGLDEKIRCEAATFAWISENCPRVPIPHLWGFGLPNGSSVCLVISRGNIKLTWV